MRRPDPLIVGAGPAGTAAAIVLARAGAQPTMLERLSETGDALCGGFLSWETLRALETIGVANLDGHAITDVRLFVGRQQTQTRLPSRAIGVSRHHLDTRMQQVAIDSGAVIEWGTTVREIDGLGVRTERGERHADALFLASGKHDIRGLTRPRDGDATLGLRVKLGPHPRLTALLTGAIELHLFDRGYAGLLLQEDGRANLCLAVRKSRLAEAGGDPARLLAQIADSAPLADRLSFMEAAPVVHAIAAVPYGWRAHDTVRGVFRLGDQAAVIPSLAGEGVGIAVASGIAAAQAWIERGAAAAPEWQRAFASRTRRPVGIARYLWERAETPWSATLGLATMRLLPSVARELARGTRIGA